MTQDMVWLEECFLHTWEEYIFCYFWVGYLGFFSCFSFSAFFGLFLHLLLLDFNASTVILMLYWAFPVGWLSSKRIPLQCRRCLRQGFYPWIKKSLCRRAWQSTPRFLPPESHGQMRLAGYSPWGHKE